MKKYLEEYKKWCESSEFDGDTKKELLSIEGNEEEIEDSNLKVNSISKI